MVKLWLGPRRIILPPILRKTGTARGPCRGVKSHYVPMCRYGVNSTLIAPAGVPIGCLSRGNFCLEDPYYVTSHKMGGTLMLFGFLTVRKYAGCALSKNDTRCDVIRSFFHFLISTLN